MITGSSEVHLYLSNYSDEVRERLELLRSIVHAEAPEASESISYGLIAYKLAGKPLIYFGGFKRHIGLYATPTGHEAFKKDFARYKQGKGSVQFPLDQSLPLMLIRRIVRFRVHFLTNAKD